MGYTGRYSSQVSQDAVMEELHLGYPGVPHMKVITKRYLPTVARSQQRFKAAGSCL